MQRHNKQPTLPVPTESVEQQQLFRWAAWQSGQYPELQMMYHVPNGGSRTKAEGGRFKAEGVKSGVPDICLPVARGGYHGLYIELKRIKGGCVSCEQQYWLDKLGQQGYKAVVCKGYEVAVSVIIKYLTLE